MNTKKCEMIAKIALFSFFFVIFVSPLAAQNANEVLSKLSALSEPERMSKLGEGVRREGALKFYSSEDIGLLEKYREAFVKRYPFVKVEYWRGGGDKTAARVQAEHRAKKLDVDVIGISFDAVVMMQREGIFARYDSPERRFYSPSFKDDESRYTATNFIPAVIAYNTRLVRKEEAPKDYPDLLQPRWKGEVSIDTEPSRAIMGWLLSWGEDKTRAYIRGLVRNEVVVRRGHSLQTQLVCAGESKVAVELYAYRVAQMKHERGCPIAQVFPTPTPAASAQLWGITSGSPRPHAAALFVDFILSEEGSRILATTGRIPTRRGIKALYEEVSDLEEKRVPFVMISPEEGFKLRELANRLREEILMAGRS